MIGTISRPVKKTGTLIPIDISGSDTGSTKAGISYAGVNPVATYSPYQNFGSTSYIVMWVESFWFHVLLQHS